MPLSIRFACLLWGLIVATGFGYGLWYDTTPTSTNDVSDRWPAETGCVLATNRPTLLMFVHPRCPCSRASLNELSVLMTSCYNRARVEVLFFQPIASEDKWANTDLWMSANRIPGIVMRKDAEGIEQRRFGARVSGEVFLYSPSGELLFHGGLTGARGHAGDNAGRLVVEALLLGKQPPVDTTPVFGCELESIRADRAARRTIFPGHDAA